jgi:hypothetical protein
LEKLNTHKENNEKNTICYIFKNFEHVFKKILRTLLNNICSGEITNLQDTGHTLLVLVLIYKDFYLSCKEETLSSLRGDQSRAEK